MSRAGPGRAGHDRRRPARVVTPAKGEVPVAALHVPAVLLALLVAPGLLGPWGLLAAPTVAEGLAQHVDRRRPPAPVPGVPPAVAAVPESGPAGPGKGDALVAWLGERSGDRRVLVTSLDGDSAPGDGGPFSAPGPPGPGDDGLPAAAILGDAVWVAAARGDGEGSRLWTRARTPAGWQPLAPVPPADRWNHHPALAGHGDALWIVWVAESDDPAASSLHVARWDGSRWSAPERLPVGAVRGRPGAPALAVDAAGRPAVVWSARDGHDTEIWLTWRDATGWRAPTPLSHNEGPDLFPSAGFAVDELWVAWSSRADDGYRVLARHGRPGEAVSAWSRPETVATEPGSGPRVVASADGVAVVWAGEGSTGERMLRASVPGADGGWAGTVDLTPVGGTPVAAAPGADGTTLLAWVREGGLHGGRARGRAAGPGVQTRLELEPSPRPSGFLVVGSDPAHPEAGATPDPRALERVPQIFSAFGDSITNGVMRVGGDRVTGEGYRLPLRMRLRALFGSAEVINNGVDGETTATGVGRIDNVVEDDDPDAVLILEGTNDITLLVDPPDIAANLQRMAERVFEEKDDVLVFLSLIPPQNRADEGFEGPFNRRVDEANALLPDAATDTGSILVDMHAPFDGNADLYSDQVHPDDEGYEVMGETWFDAIRPVALDLTNRGDVDGSGRVDGVDLVRLALAFGARSGQPRYDEAADVTGDGLVDGFDLSILSEFFGTRPGEGDGS